MFKTTSTFSQARNITIALTMSLAAATLVTGCGNDDSADTTPAPEAEMSSENQNNMTQDNTTTSTDTEMTMDAEPTAEPDEIDMSSEADVSASDDTSAVQADASASDEVQTHTVNAQGLKFDPLVVKINSGDSVEWRNMATHNTESLEGLIPAGAEKWNSPIGKSYKRTFTEEGIYVYKCTPHFGTGMGGAIIVGEPVNLEQIKNADVSGAAGRLVREAIAAAESM